MPKLASMTKKEKVQYVIDTLEELYPEVPIPLDHYDPFTLLVAVVLSAQCTDVRVNKITPSLFALADNPYDMAKLSVEEIAEIIFILCASGSYITGETIHINGGMLMA